MTDEDGESQTDGGRFRRLLDRFDAEEAVGDPDREDDSVTTPDTDAGGTSAAGDQGDSGAEARATSEGPAGQAPGEGAQNGGRFRRLLEGQGAEEGEPTAGATDAGAANPAVETDEGGAEPDEASAGGATPEGADAEPDASDVPATTDSGDVQSGDEDEAQPSGSQRDDGESWVWQGGEEASEGQEPPAAADEADDEGSADQGRPAQTDDLPQPDQGDGTADSPPAPDRSDDDAGGTGREAFLESDIDSLDPPGGQDRDPRGDTPSAREGGPMDASDGVAAGGGAAPAEPAEPDWEDVGSSRTDDSGPETTGQALLLNTDEDRACVMLCEQLMNRDGTDPNLLVVAVADSPADRLKDIYGGQCRAEEIVIIDVGSSGTAAETDASVEAAGTAGEVTVRSVMNAGDVSRLGMMIDRVLSDWGDDRPVGVCFHSVTALLESVDQQTAFQFFHVLNARLRTAGATSHAHMDPTEHSIESVQTLQPLFDQVLRVTADGSIEAVQI